MENIKAKALTKKGQFANIKYARPCKTLKGAPEIVKTTTAYNVRIGAQYDALKSTQEAKGVSSTEEAHAVNQGLKGFEWVQYPYILKATKSGKEYVRIETAKNSKFETVYTMNGKVISKAEAEPYLQSSEKKHGDMPNVMNIGLENITEIH